MLACKPENVREVRLRTSFVIGRNGGALKELSGLVRLGLGGTVGNGRQGMSWIHEADMNEIVYQAIVNDRYTSVYVASAPNPVSNYEFMKTLRRTLGMPIGLSSPAWLTKIGAHFIFRTDPELAIYGRYVKSERLENEGPVFKFPTLEEALRDLLKK